MIKITMVILILGLAIPIVSAEFEQAGFGIQDCDYKNFGNYNLELPWFREECISSVTNLTGNLTTFLQLNDTPSSYSGEAGNCARVNAGEDALEFGACGIGGAFDLNISNGTTQSVVTESGILNLLGSSGILTNLESTNFTFNLNFSLLNSLYNDTVAIQSVNTTENIEALGFVTGNHTTGDSLNNSLSIYFDHSMKSQITYNLTEADENQITITTQPGTRFIFGDDFI